MRPVCLLMIFLLFTLLYPIIELKMHVLILLKEPSRKKAPLSLHVTTEMHFCSGIQFYLLLSPYICFISFLYLDLYVLGDNALIS